MLTTLSRVFQKRSSKTQNRPAPRALPRVEELERREVMSVTYQGGGVLPHVEVQGLYYGADWYNNSTYHSQTGYLEGFLNNVVHGSYLSTLTNAGYGVGTGSFSSGQIGLANINKSFYLTDGQIRSALQSYISSGVLQQPDANRLYVIYVEPGVAISMGGGNSQRDFLGYHGAFAGHDSSGHAADIHYAVIAYPGGSVGNASVSYLSTLNQLTEVTSHELAESVTDPNVNYKGLGWYDSTLNGEIGDLANGQTVYLNGYAVQRVVDKNDQAMTPMGAQPALQEDFVLQQNGFLYKHTSAGLTFLSSGIASVSDQSIDNRGQAMVDVVTTGGLAYEYHEGFGWVYLGSGVKSAVSGQGVSYLLYNNGNLYEYKDATGGYTYIFNNIASISAGTDRYGVNMVDVVFPAGYAWEHSDSTGWHYIDSNVKAISAGQQGISDLLYNTGNAYWFNEATGSFAFLASNVAQVTAGVDQNGNYQIDLLYTNGSLQEYGVGSGWTTLTSGVTSISKAHAGTVDVLFSSGNAYAHTASGQWIFLDSGVKSEA
jgi:hypothetical protein